MNIAELTKLDCLKVKLVPGWNVTCFQTCCSTKRFFCIKKHIPVAQSESSCRFYILCHLRAKYFVSLRSNTFLFCFQIVLSTLFKETNEYRVSSGPRVSADVSRFYVKACDIFECALFRAVNDRTTYVHVCSISSVECSSMSHFKIQFL
jgi:hypothetical protein